MRSTDSFSGEESDFCETIDTWTAVEHLPYACVIALKVDQGIFVELANASMTRAQDAAGLSNLTQAHLKECAEARF